MCASFHGITLLSHIVREQDGRLRLTALQVSGHKSKYWTMSYFDLMVEQDKS